MTRKACRSPTSRRGSCRRSSPLPRSEGWARSRRPAKAALGEATPKSLKVARTFNSIGRRNESLRAQLDAVEFSFRNIELIRSQFYDVLGPIDQTLVEIERTKVAHLEAERKLEALTDALDRLKGDHAGLTLERNALALKQEELSGRVTDLEKSDRRRGKSLLRKPAPRSRTEAPSWSAPSGNSKTTGGDCKR